MSFNQRIHELQASHDEEGFTLIDMVVSMVIGGLLTIMVFNLFNTAMEVSEVVAEPVNRTVATQSALTSLTKAVRNAREQRVTEDGKALYILNQENEYTVWRSSEEGLSNGSRTYSGVKSAHFEDIDGLIRVTLTTADDQTASRTLRSPFPTPSAGDRVFTDTFINTHLPTD